jgi:hypothetical protein
MGGISQSDRRTGIGHVPRGAEKVGGGSKYAGRYFAAPEAQTAPRGLAQWLASQGRQAQLVPEIGPLDTGVASAVYGVDRFFLDQGFGSRAPACGLDQQRAAVCQIGQTIQAVLDGEKDRRRVLRNNAVDQLRSGYLLRNWSNRLRTIVSPSPVADGW